MSFVLALLLALGFLGQPAMDSDPAPCSPVVMAKGADYSDLLDAGWVGQASDGMEALYAPGC